MRSGRENAFIRRVRSFRGCTSSVGVRWMSEAGVYAFNYTVGIHEYIYIYPGKDSRRLRNAIELTARYRVELPSDVLLSSSPAACLSFIPDIWTTNRRLARASAEHCATSSKPPLTPCYSSPYGRYFGPLEWPVESSFRGIGERSTSQWKRWRIARNRVPTDPD